MNPSDLTGRDLDLAVTEALGIDTPWPMGWCEPRKIPELFAEIAARNGGGTVGMVRLPSGGFTASCFSGLATGATPNEALARLLLMVAQR